jgi:predicted Zn-dependent peptidase
MKWTQERVSFRLQRTLDFIRGTSITLSIIKKQEEIINRLLKSLGAIAADNSGDFSKYEINNFLEHIKIEKRFCEDLIKEIDTEIVKLQNELISEKDYQKLQNVYENNYVNSNSSVEGVAENLSSYYLLYGDVNLINTEIEMYRSISREEIRDVAKKYLNPNQRLILDYVPSKDKAQK